MIVQPITSIDLSIRKCHNPFSLLFAFEKASLIDRSIAELDHTKSVFQIIRPITHVLTLIIIIIICSFAVS
jgi:hypothetical protein